MKGMVIYDSVFGNTEKIAQEVANVLGSSAEVALKRVSEANVEDVPGLDWLVMGSPTRGFRPTEGISKFLSELPEGALAGVKVSAFDTRIPLETIKSSIFRFIVKKGGYADKLIGKGMQMKGGILIEPTEGFFVKESKGPLVEGELERAAAWAARIRAG